MYLSYFKEHTATEMGRIKDQPDANMEEGKSLYKSNVVYLTDVQHIDGETISMAIRSQCFEKFKEAYPGTWIDILTTHHQLQIHDPGQKTFQQRTRDFHRTWKAVTELVGCHHAVFQRVAHLQ
jgi:hypothetical protein